MVCFAIRKLLCSRCVQQLMMTAMGLIEAPKDGASSRIPFREGHCIHYRVVDHASRTRAILPAFPISDGASKIVRIRVPEGSSCYCRFVLELVYCSAFALRRAHKQGAVLEIRSLEKLKPPLNSSRGPIANEQFVMVIRLIR